MAERFSMGHANMVCAAVRTAYTNAVLEIYGGASQPADSGDAEAGTLLAVITRGGGAFTAGNAANGLNFDAAVNGVLSKAAAETWTGNGLPAAGTGTAATYFRFYANAFIKGASTTAVRFDGAISSLSTAEIQMGVTTVANGVPVTINSFTYAPPRS